MTAIVARSCSILGTNLTWTDLQFVRSLTTQGGDGLGNAYFFKKRANFFTERVHCFDSFKSWVLVMFQWGNGFFAKFLVED